MKLLQAALLKVYFVVLFLTASTFAFTQSPDKVDIAIDAAVRAEVIESVIKQLNEHYIFPETAKAIEKAIREGLKKKEYDQIVSAVELAKTLTALFREISHDQHLSLNFSPEPLPVRQKKSEPTPAEREGTRNYGEAINFGF